MRIVPTIKPITNPNQNECMYKLLDKQESLHWDGQSNKTRKWNNFDGFGDWSSGSFDSKPIFNFSPPTVNLI